MPEVTQVVDMITDAYGDRIDVAIAGPEVVLFIHARDGEPMVFLNAEQRDAFVKAFVVASYRAEDGQVSDGVPAGA